MRIAIMGAGSVGCYYGGMLARQGYDVMLIGRPAHVDAINEQGLRLQTRAFDVLVPLHASTEASALTGAALVLCCVKSPDTATTARAMAPHLAADARVLSLQNGVDNVDTLRAALPQTVAPAVVYVATEMAGPGHVLHHGRGELVLPPDILTDAERASFAAAGIRLEFSDN
ncbi:MAG: ketopantoate reductase family protein, partial [Pigmentiphaga sp.]